MGVAELVPGVTVPIRPPAPVTPRWDAEQLEIVKRLIAPGVTDDELAFFAEVCQRRQLDPFAGEIVAIARWSAKDNRNVMSIQITVDGLRAIAERSGVYAGPTPAQWCGPDLLWREVWLDPGPPAAAKVGARRLGWPEPVFAVARWASYVQLNPDGKPKALWKSHPDVMLAKCAESAALKRAFPRQLVEAGIAVREELSTAQVISMEARAVGLDDDGRHALVAEVTNGRTESSRGVTEEEALAARERLAQLRTEPTDAALWEELRIRLNALPGPDRSRVRAWLGAQGMPSNITALNLNEVRMALQEVARREQPGDSGGLPF